MIKLVKEVYTTTTNGYEEKLGEFVLKKDESISVTERNFIKPIPKSTLLFKNFSFFIDRISQDIVNQQLIFYEELWVSRYTTEKDLLELKKEYTKVGWKWIANDIEI